MLLGWRLPTSRRKLSQPCLSVRFFTMNRAFFSLAADENVLSLRQVFNIARVREQALNSFGTMGILLGCLQSLRMIGARCVTASIAWEGTVYEESLRT